MTDKKDSSLFGKLFKQKDTDKSPSVTRELLLCLQNLSAIGEGRDRKVDTEITKFKKMVQIGSSVEDLQQQISVISKTLVQSTATPETNKLAKLFKQIPAQILVDEFLSYPLSDTIKIKLQNYRNSLSKGMLASNCIPDLIEILEPEPAANLEDVSVLDSSSLKNIVTPLLELFSQIELSKDQNKQLQEIFTLSTKMTDLYQLARLVENISQLILGSFATSSGKFESFLLQLKQRLETVTSCISKSSETSQAIAECSETFSQCVSAQVNNIQTSLDDPELLGSLEQTIAQNLESIVAGVCSFESKRKVLEKEASNQIADLKHELEHTRSETNYLKDNLQQQRDRALTDPLTKLPNRHAYNERLHLEYNRWRRYNKPLSLIMVDIDLFKNINDDYGHLAGDSALRETAQIIQQGIRGTDFVARFGGEEFILLMPETSITEATKTVNKIRLSIQNNQIHEGAANFTLTASFGVSTFEEDDTFSSVLERADKALYRAKKKGRNQVCVQRKSDQ